MSYEQYTFAYKIGESFPSETPLPVSELDRKDGFIHMSTADQVPGTVGRFFKGVKKVTLIKVRLQTIDHKLKWEQSSNHGTFPHIYGDLLQSDIVDRAEFTLDEGGDWETLLSQAEFLEK
ncbi:hypothetical protein PYCC9005_001989 [Savitreella phatthalungensis]